VSPGVRAKRCRLLAGTRAGAVAVIWFTRSREGAADAAMRGSVPADAA